MFRFKHPATHLLNGNGLEKEQCMLTKDLRVFAEGKVNTSANNDDVIVLVRT